MFKIVQIQLSNKSAGSCAQRLHGGFSGLSSVESSAISLFEDKIKYDGIHYLGKLPQIKALLNNWLENKRYKYDNRKFGLFSYPVLGSDISRIKLIQEANAVYIHWVQLGFFDFKSFERLFKLEKKIFVVMHDMWFMTGGCHYAVDCDSYINGCETCPIFPEDKSIASSQHTIKKELISKYGDKIQFITPSLWLQKLCLKSSLLKGQKVHFIPNYFDSPHFKKTSQLLAREALKIDSNKLILCFGAVNISSIYKGWKFLKDAFTYLNDFYTYDQLEVVIFGNGDLQEFQSAIDFKIHYLGFLEDEAKISLAYKCSDVFVIPSILDNQPTTIVESLHCGVPVVGFNLCGIPEMIDHKKNGYIAEAYDSNDLAKGIRYCLDNKLEVKLKREYLGENVLDSHFQLLKVNSSND